MARRLTVVLTFLLLAACRTPGSVNEPMGQFFSASQAPHGIVSLAGELPAQLAANDDAVVMVYNHGTDWGGQFQDCDPGTMPTFIKRWARNGLDGHDVIVFYLCTQEVEDRSAMGKSRAIENEAVLDRIIAAGVPPGNIFVLGHSGGASTALLTAERAPEKFNAAVVSAPGYGLAWLEAEGEGGNWLDVEYSKWRTELVGADDMAAFVLLYEGDLWSPPSDATFLANHPGVEVFTIRDDDGDGVLCPGQDEPHFYWWTRCFVSDQLGTVERFIVDRLNERQAAL